MYEQDILETFNDKNCKNPKKLSKVLCKKASEMQKDKLRMSPFALRARNLCLPYKGGKFDDCSVAVTLVQ